jgi:hypothetical protein
MSSVKYILTKYERILRVEKVEYMVEIPEDTKDKVAYAGEQVLDSNYTDCRVVDIPFSEMLDEEIHGLRRVKSPIL